jgi:hypothetical protein
MIIKVVYSFLCAIIGLLLGFMTLCFLSAIFFIKDLSIAVVFGLVSGGAVFFCDMERTKAFLLGVSFSTLSTLVGTLMLWLEMISDNIFNAGFILAIPVAFCVTHLVVIGCLLLKISRINNKLRFFTGYVIGIVIAPFVMFLLLALLGYPLTA